MPPSRVILRWGRSAAQMLDFIHVKIFSLPQTFLYSELSRFKVLQRGCEPSLSVVIDSILKEDIPWFCSSHFSISFCITVWDYFVFLGGGVCFEVDTKLNGEHQVVKWEVNVYMSSWFLQRGKCTVWVEDEFLCITLLWNYCLESCRVRVAW